MSSRPAGRTAFEGLRPTIMREPLRTPVSSDAEARLLDKPTESQPELVSGSPPASGEGNSPNVEAILADEASRPFPSPRLLTKKKRDLLIPVTFRMPQSLKHRLEKTARDREINQTDLINEAIELNLSRYL